MIWSYLYKQGVSWVYVIMFTNIFKAWCLFINCYLVKPSYMYMIYFLPYSSSYASPSSLFQTLPSYCCSFSVYYFHIYVICVCVCVSFLYLYERKQHLPFCKLLIRLPTVQTYPVKIKKAEWKHAIVHIYQSCFSISVLDAYVYSIIYLLFIMLWSILIPQCVDLKSFGEIPRGSIFEPFRWSIISSFKRKLTNLYSDLD